MRSICKSIAADVACCEPFTKALPSWLHISRAKSKRSPQQPKTHPPAAAVAQPKVLPTPAPEPAVVPKKLEVAPVAPVQAVKEKKKCLCAVPACLVCGGHKQKAQKSRSIEVVKSSEPTPAPKPQKRQEKIAPKKATGQKRLQWCYVFVEENRNMEKWVAEEAHKLTGDYREEGTYEDRKYFVRKDRGKEKLCIFWSTYFGFDGGWYIGPTLGGSSSAWIMLDQKTPPQRGWQMRGSVPGFHEESPIRINMKSTLMHEVHVCEFYLLGPCRFLGSLGSCLTGACIATAHGSTAGVSQLKERPRCNSCMTGMLNDMSCSTPLSWAFEHTVDAWYKAFFIDGFCYTAWYERGIVSTERSMKMERLRLRYGGYTSRVAQELACHEPFAHALADLLHVSSTRTSDNFKRAKSDEETGCLHAILQHLGNCAQVIIPCLFGPGNKKETVKSRELTVKSRELTVEPSQSGTAVVITEAQNKQLAGQVDLVAKKQRMSDMQADLETLRQQSAKLDSEIAQRKQALATRDSNLIEVEAVYAQKLQDLETNSKQKAAENESLQPQVDALKQKAHEYRLKRQSDQEKTVMLTGVRDTQSSRIRELEIEIQRERESNSKSTHEIAQLEELHNRKLQEVELANAKLAQHRQQLERDLKMRQQQEGMQEMHIKEVEVRYAEQRKNMETTYSSQIQALTLQANEADGNHQILKQQLELTSQQHQEEKAHLKQQYDMELSQAKQFRASIEAECKILLSQLDASTSHAGQRKAVADEFESRRQALERQHVEQVQELQQAVAIANEQSVELEQKLLALQREQSDNQIRKQKLEEARTLMQTLEAKEKALESRTDLPELESTMEAKRNNYIAQVTELENALNAAREDRKRHAERELQTELDEMVTAMEAKRTSYMVQVSELEQALSAATDDATVLREQLDKASADKAQRSARYRVRAQSQLAGTAVRAQPQLEVKTATVTRRFVADTMDSSAVSLEAGTTVDVLSTNGPWARVQTATGQTSEVPLVCLNIQDSSQPEGSYAQAFLQAAETVVTAPMTVSQTVVETLMPSSSSSAGVPGSTQSRYPLASALVSETVSGAEYSNEQRRWRSRNGLGSGSVYWERQQPRSDSIL